MKNLICIVCPKGCHLTVDEQADCQVIGAQCCKGVDYAKAEVENPMRVLTSTVVINSAKIARLPVKTSKPISKKDIFNVMEKINSITVASPISVGEILVKNICNTKADLVATRNL